MSAVSLHPHLSPIVASVETVTPRQAREWLDGQAPNRNLRRKKIDRLVREISSGMWMVNGETIKFDRHNRMIDGQNRCQAIVEADISIRSVIVRGLDPDVQMTVDRGTSRKHSDDLAIRGIPNSKVVSAVARQWWLYERGRTMETADVSESELDAMIAQHPTIVEGASVGNARRDLKRLCPGSVSGFVFAYVAERDRAKASRFFDQLSTGAGLPDRHPVLALRRQLISNSIGKHKLPHREILHLLIKTFNYSEQDRRVDLVHVRRKGPGSEKPPRFHF